MAYTVRANRNDDGSYSLSYGKGGKKLAATLKNDTARKAWFVVGFGEDKVTKREAVAAWAAWAASEYGSPSAPETPGQTATTSADAPPAAHAGPPKYTPKPKPAESKIITGMDGVTRKIVYGDDGTVIEKSVAPTQETPHVDAEPVESVPPSRPPRYTPAAKAPVAHDRAAEDGSQSSVSGGPEPDPAVQG